MSLYTDGSYSVSMCMSAHVHAHITDRSFSFCVKDVFVF